MARGRLAAWVLIGWAALVPGCLGGGTLPAGDADATADDDDVTADDDDTTGPPPGDDDATPSDCEDPSPEELAALDAAVHAYLTVDDEDAAADQLDPLVEALTPVCFEHVAAAIRAWPADPDAPQAGFHEETYRVAAADMDATLHVFVPESTDLTTGQRVPLYLFLHGAGGDDGSSWVHDPTVQAPARDTGGVLAAPTALEHCDWSAWEACASQTLSALRHLKRHYPIDDDRVYLSGHSMGGRGSFTVGLTWPDRFAGLYPTAGTIGATADTLDVAVHEAYCHDHVENALHQRVALYTGMQDSEYLVAQNEGAAAVFDALGYDFRWVAVADAGHMFPFDRWGDDMAWVDDVVRPRSPDHVVLDVAWHDSNILEHLFLYEDLLDAVYWLRVDARADADAPARVEATVAGGTVTVTTDNVEALTLLLDDELLDLDAPVTVEVDGATWFTGTVERSPRVALTAARARGERSMVSAAALSGAVPGEGTPRDAYGLP